MLGAMPYYTGRLKQEVGEKEAGPGACAFIRALGVFWRPCVKSRLANSSQKEWGFGKHCIW